MESFTKGFAGLVYKPSADLLQIRVVEAPSATRTRLPGCVRGTYRIRVGGGFPAPPKGFVLTDEFDELLDAVL